MNIKKIRKIRKIIIIILVILVIGIINYEKIQFFYYIITRTSNSKEMIEKKYDIQLTSMMNDKNNYLYEGIEKDTLRKKYIVKVSGKGTFTVFADEGVDISNAQAIAKKNGFPSPPIYFYIKDTFTEEKSLADYLFWYVINDEGRIMYISFKDGAVTYSK
jgi:hypothetical protein